DYVEGASLSELRKELAAAERAVDTKVAVKVILDALAGLHAAHMLRDENGRHLGIVHRDISPHNVLLGVDGKSRLTDFGIAHAVDRVQVTRTHEVKGKLAYLAPERIDKRRMCTVQSDVFSMAVVLWECLAGRRLFRGDEAIDTLQEVLTSHIPRLRLLGAQVPPALDDAIMRGLSRDLHVRYATAEQFARAIAHAAGRGNIGTEADVAHVVETVFGPRIGMRHEQVRGVVSDETAQHLFELSHIKPRPAPPPNEVIPQPMLYAAIAPAAPSARYAFGNLNDSLSGANPAIKQQWPLIAAISGGAAVALAVLLVLVFHMHERDHDAAATAPSGSAAFELPASSAAASAATRHVVVPLPFVATRIWFDDAEHDLDPPADVAAFDIPIGSPTRHHLVASGENGAQAEGFLRETDGVAAPEGGFNTLIPPVAAPVATAEPVRHHSSHHHAAPASTTRRDGFTKLK
ncbi:MAG: protein kinase domain-containing protein, partial [Polyangiaceae bacterium]